MTKVGKALAVFVLAASLAFMGFAAVHSAGGVNWDGEKRALESDYIFEYSGGESPTWSVKRRRDDQSVGSPSRVLPSLIIAVRQDQTAAQKKQIDRLDPQNPRVQARIEEATRLIQLDEQAMASRTQALAEELEQQDATTDTIAKEGDKTAQEALAVRREAERRREDVFRLRSQLEETQTDQFRIAEQKRRLQDLLTRIRGVNERLERRRLQLEAATNSDNK